MVPIRPRKLPFSIERRDDSVSWSWQVVLSILHGVGDVDDVSQLRDVEGREAGRKARVREFPGQIGRALFSLEHINVARLEVCRKQVAVPTCDIQGSALVNIVWGEGTRASRQWCQARVANPKWIRLR